MCKRLQECPYYIFTSYISIFSFPSLTRFLLYHPISFIQPLPCNVYLVTSFHISTNASIRLFSFRLNILTSCLFHLSDDQLLHFPSLLLLPFSSTYIILYLLITSYNYKTVLLTYFLHTFCIVLNNLHLSNLLRSRAIVCWRQSVDRARPCWRTRLHGHDTVAISGWSFSKWATKKNLQHPTELWKKKTFQFTGAACQW